MRAFKTGLVAFGAALVAAMLWAPAAEAQPSTGRLIDVRVVDSDSGRGLPVYRHRGRLHIAGLPGKAYTVSLRNLSGERVLVVLAIDGVNAVTGETANPAQSGYVLGPFERAEIRGWRKSLAESAEFYFTELPDSYAARTGRPFDVGVIGVAVFREAWRPRTPAPPIARDDGFGSKDGARGEAPTAAAPEAKGYGGESRSRQELGTGHGERRFDPVNETRFVRASRDPAEVVALFYDDYDKLVADGVIPRSSPRRVSGGPDPFPARFVPDPHR